MSQPTFYPGPSKVYSSVPDFIREAYEQGILSANHRSEAFMALMRDTVAVLKDRLAIPADYQVMFTSSATESWEIIAQSLTERSSQHFFSGAFGEKWHSYASKITRTEAVPFDVETRLPVDRISGDADVVCYTQNETSNATQVTADLIREVRQRAKGIVAVDVTSSIGGIGLDFSQADVWYGSVQKCFGLPAGLGVLIVSPAAVEKARKLNERNHYNSLVNILDNAEKDQTPYTPNVLGIYLLYRTQQAANPIDYICQMTQERYRQWTEFFEGMNDFELLIANESVRSETVLAVKHPDPQAVRAKSLEHGIVLGNGYGQWKPSTFRVANFPAIEQEEIDQLKSFFQRFYS